MSSPREDINSSLSAAPKLGGKDMSSPREDINSSLSAASKLGGKYGDVLTDLRDLLQTIAGDLRVLRITLCSEELTTGKYIPYCGCVVNSTGNNMTILDLENGSVQMTVEIPDKPQERLVIYPFGEKISQRDIGLPSEALLIFNIGQIQGKMRGLITKSNKIYQISNFKIYLGDNRVGLEALKYPVMVTGGFTLKSLIC